MPRRGGRAPVKDGRAIRATHRSAWPSVEAGYRLDETSYYWEIQDDDQFYFDRFGGFYRAAQTVRSAVVFH